MMVKYKLYLNWKMMKISQAPAEWTKGTLILMVIRLISLSRERHPCRRRRQTHCWVYHLSNK